MQFSTFILTKKILKSSFVFPDTRRIAKIIRYCPITYTSDQTSVKFVLYNLETEENMKVINLILDG